MRLIPGAERHSKRLFFKFFRGNCIFIHLCDKSWFLMLHNDSKQLLFETIKNTEIKTIVHEMVVMCERAGSLHNLRPKRFARNSKQERQSNNNKTETHFNRSWTYIRSIWLYLHFSGFRRRTISRYLINEREMWLGQIRGETSWPNNSFRNPDIQQNFEIISFLIVSNPFKVARFIRPRVRVFTFWMAIRVVRLFELPIMTSPQFSSAR
jgi:hypothetical protein